MKIRRFLYPLCVALSLLVAQSAQAVTHIQYLDGVTGLTGFDYEGTPTAPTHSGETDYSDSGLDLGDDGFIFFNWDAPSPTQGVWNNADVTSQNVNNQLPSWLSLDFDPLSADYSFGNDTGQEAFAKGGDSLWDTLTLPDGDIGLSGALVDPRAAGNSNNTISALNLLAGAPSSFWMHIVTDNTNGDHDPDERFRARMDSNGSSRLNSIPLNGTADVYSFLYTGAEGGVGDYIKIQLRSTSSGESPSIAGLMFDVVPEPSSALLLVLGGLGLIARRRR